MYSEETIVEISERQGFGIPLEDGFSIEVDEANSVGSTGRFFKSFHSLVTVENIFAATPDLGEEADEKFNNILIAFRYQATREIIPLIMDKNAQYDNATGYDQTILDNAVLFDDAVGYKVAMMVLEYFMSTKESNLAERNAKCSIAALKLELEGIRNDSGVLVANGLVQKFQSAIKKATNKIFPIKPTVGSSSIW
ncbi:hypothetical protein [Flavobacterium sp. 102]|uniref:hypothetical protein n=1 Tax=Flavobacterium sp. 102 TaxID=2135623 RepID=UPI000EB328CA|nr:hypothetical protein [Flavobacterium sp. 102]RKS00419.1 hypothetical protein C8C84_0027 [Flavobacterium sp. 102]